MDKKRTAPHWIARHFYSASPAKTGCTLFVAVMLQWAALLAVCPAVHELIHRDADDEHHDCAVTMFAAGQVEHSPIQPIVAAKPILVAHIPERIIESVAASSFFLICRILEHAPPLR